MRLCLLVFPALLAHVHAYPPPGAQERLSEHMPVSSASGIGANCLVSPMPGVLISVSVAKGDTVVAGQELAVVEAMKMQNVLRAPCDGTVSELVKEVGATVNVDDVLLEFAQP